MSQSTSPSSPAVSRTSGVTLDRLSEDILLYRTDISGLLPAAWQEAIATCSREFSQWRTLGGASSTSREDAFQDRAVPEVGVVTGDVVHQRLPWLDQLYRGELLELANSLGPQRYAVSADLRAGVNINTTRRNARYEWHVDSNPLTGLLFVTTLPPAAGGQLVFRPDPVSRPGEDWAITVSPVAGQLLLFDARQAAHVVTTLLSDQRISVPMNYYFEGREERPGDLDAYLYG